MPVPKMNDLLQLKATILIFIYVINITNISGKSGHVYLLIYIIGDMQVFNAHTSATQLDGFKHLNINHNYQHH